MVNALRWWITAPVVMGSLWVTTAAQVPRRLQLEPVASAPPEIVTQTGHSRTVRGIAMHPDGVQLATASDDWSIALWDTRTSLTVRRFGGHVDDVTSVAFSRDGARLYSGSRDQTVRVWDVRSGRELQRFPLRVSGIARLDGAARASGGRVYALAADPQGRYLLAGTAGGAVLIDAATGNEVRRFPRLQTDIFSVAFTADGGQAIVGYWDGAREWDLTTFDREKHYDRQRDEKDTLAVGFSSDHVWAFSATPSSVGIFRRSTGQRVATLRPPGGSPFTAAAAARSRNLAATAQEDGTVTIWDLSTGAAVQTLRKLLSGITSVAFTLNGTEVYGGLLGGALGWRLQDGRLSNMLRAPLEYAHHAPLAMAVHPAGSHLVTGSLLSDLTVLNLRTGQIDSRFGRMSSYITAMAMSRDGQRLLTAAANGHLALDEFASGKRLGEIRLEQRVSDAALRNEREAVVATSDGVVLVDLLGGRVVRQFGRFGLAAVAADVESVVIDDSGRYVVAGFHDSSGGVRVWNLDTGNTVKTLGGGVFTRGWATGHTDPINAVALSADGRTVASGSDDRTARVWDLATGGERCRATHDAPVTLLTMNPTGTLIATVSGGRGRLWSGTCSFLREFSGHWSEVLQSVFSPADPNTLITLANDRTVRFWKVDTGREQFGYLPLSTTAWLFMTPEGLFDGTPGSAAALAWRFQNDTVPAEAFLREYFRPNLARDLLAGRSPAPARPLASVDRRLPVVTVRAGDASRLTSASRLLDVEVTVQPAPATLARPARGTVQGVRLFRNGRLVKVWPEVSALVPLREPVAIVAGSNVITAYAFNGDNVKSLQGEARVEGPASLQRTGKTYVIAVGINGFRAAVPRLEFAEGDAQVIANELYARGTKTGREVRRVRLIGPNATRDRVLRVIRRLAGDLATPVIEDNVTIDPAEPEDLVILYFATHGRTSGDDYYLWPYDVGVPATAAEHSRGNTISRQDLEPLLERMDAGDLVLIADACHSGQLLETTATVGPFNSSALAQLAYDKGMSVVTASQSHQSALETSLHGRGLLTYALINEGIQQMRADTSPVDFKVSIREWLEYAERQVPALYAEVVRQRKELGSAFRALSRGDGNSDFQQPRIFFRADGDQRPVVIAVR